MLEIIFVVYLCGKIGDMCRAKRQAAGGFQFLLVLFWIGGEILGAVVGAMVTPGEMAFIYLAAILGAAIGAAIVFVIVHLIPSLQQPRTSGGPSPAGSSDWEMQLLWNAEQECEQRGDWQQALANLQLILTRTSNPQFTTPAQQRYTQIQQWLAQQGMPQGMVPPRRM